MKCISCGQECFEEQYPEVVFRDDKHNICEECSIDYEERNGKVRVRKDVLKDVGLRTDKQYAESNCVLQW